MEARPDSRVYVVDDDGSVRKALGRLLSSAGYVAEVFSSSESFRESVMPGTRGVLVLDLRMPGMDGFALQLRLLEEESPLRIILMTAFAQPGERRLGMGRGAVGFLVKPFEDVLLLDLIEEAVAG